ncbi:MAG: ribonuclease HIII [Verrucomicrobia bacterium]|nr:ribonuclease HIII [Verrucomicrobiota bacterium]MBU4289699.1 ribonuclease HIII [Verrucomicrobiota bacterium]MBU4496422.1 ribonuclease HIII [Verrucomicrobiota bacterium]MCG2678814.1 ribonuclease HIII [Kiritimatiellia bacterium]
MSLRRPRDHLPRFEATWLNPSLGCKASGYIIISNYIIMDPPLKTSFTHKLTDEQQILLTELLQTGNYRPVAMEHTVIAAETNDCRIALYTSGKCLVQGKGAQDFVTFVLEPKVLESVRVGYEEMLNPEAYAPHMGIDESGKGDFFGPLVIAGAYADKSLAHTMLAMGVKDSKNISSDKRALELGRDIRKLLGKRFSVVLVGPESYNRLYAKMRSVNNILSWGHARAIENLLANVPDCPRAISDQFGDKKQVERALMGKGRKIELVQRHRAEADVAVAAASILARSAFLHTLQQMGASYELKLPKGASEAVIAAGQALVEKHGPPILLKAAKCHFRTADVVLSKLSLNRSVLGPVGAAISKPRRDFHRRHSDAR